MCGHAWQRDWVGHCANCLIQKWMVKTVLQGFACLLKSEKRPKPYAHTSSLKKLTAEDAEGAEKNSASFAFSAVKSSFFSSVAYWLAQEFCR
jgi:hypothetical protein